MTLHSLRTERQPSPEDPCQSKPGNPWQRLGLLLVAGGGVAWSGEKVSTTSSTLRERGHVPVTFETSAEDVAARLIGEFLASSSC
jgi:hypothetical protein